MQRGKKQLKDGTSFNEIFRSTSSKALTLHRNADVFQTLEFMERIAHEYVGDTLALSKLLKGSSNEETSRNIWNFCVDYINYEPDHPEIEQVRTPARSWADRQMGIDCDCYSVFISTILLNLSISHSFRMADYGNGWQHVYVVAHGENGDNVIIDPVYHLFNSEKPTHKPFYDHLVMKLEMLNGLGNSLDTYNQSNYNSSLNPVMAQAHQQAMNTTRLQLQDAVALQNSTTRNNMNGLQDRTRSMMMGFGNTPPPGGEAPSVMTRTMSWVKENPLTVGLGLVGLTLGGIGLYKMTSKKKGRMSGLSGVNGLDGRRRKRRSPARKSTGRARTRSVRGMYI